MAMGQRNTAYDISIFEEREYVQKRDGNIVKLPNKKNKVNKKKKLTVMTVLFTAVTFSISIAVFGTMLSNQVQLTEIADRTNRIEKQLEESKSENTQLQMKVKEKFSPEKITYYAQNDLSMEQTNSNQIEYISLTSGDKAEITQKNQNTIFDNFLAFMGIR